jgi:arginyl-tRNA synthetase
MNIFDIIRKHIFEALHSLYNISNISAQDIGVELPRNKEHGDISTNAAMVMGKKLGKAPREIADQLCNVLQGAKEIDKIDVAGAGFINIKLKSYVWGELVSSIIALGSKYGENSVGKGQKVNIEFVSANPTGPMHIGHARGAIIGDVLAALYQKCGFNVTKEYYINDAGKQIDALALSVVARYKQLCGIEAEVPEYPGEYLIEVAKILYNEHGDTLLNGLDEKLEGIKAVTINHMMKLICDDLSLLNVQHDVFTSELELHRRGKMEEGIRKLQEAGALYRGILEAPKGKVVEDWEAKEQTLFASKQYGDDSDRPLLRHDGSYTYFASDVAYHLDKIERGFEKLILVLGADHGGYIKRLAAIVHALSNGKVEINVLLNQLVKLMKEGKPFKMSKRSGTFITIRDLIDEIGKDNLRFMMLTRKSDTQLELDLAQVLEQSKENPVFYVQYAHTRCCSILRQVANVERKVEDLDYSRMEEMEILRKIMEYPKIIENAALTCEPHKMVYYLYDLATCFHSFWAAGNADASLRMLIDGDEALSKARISMVRAVKIVIASGLQLLGVQPLDHM